MRLSQISQRSHNIDRTRFLLLHIVSHIILKLLFLILSLCTRYTSSLILCLWYDNRIVRSLTGVYLYKTFYPKTHKRLHIRLPLYRCQNLSEIILDLFLRALYRIFIRRAFSACLYHLVRCALSRYPNIRCLGYYLRPNTSLHSLFFCSLRESDFLCKYKHFLCWFQRFL